ncbi:hypothetical protein WA026_015735 [Henosepilachna vigintioctopunctata]|uniref:Uncharacterized protein n=1 Tax=Henosepilachna vigintioctopunctata TaxID=420089 RepID=A0AAW1V2B2_9CUCU
MSRLPRSDERVVGSLNGDSFSRCSVRKQRLEKSRQQLEDEAAKVLKKAREIKCVASSNKGASKDKYYTLPNRRKGIIDYETFSKKPFRKNSLESVQFPPKKPPRSFISSNDSTTSKFAQDIKQKENRKPKKSNLRRSVSDATNIKSKIFKDNNKDEIDSVFRSDTEDFRSAKRNSKKKQLSPIIEVQQREDYFSQKNENNEENEKYNNENSTDSFTASDKCNNSKKKESATESLKKFIEGLDEELFKETGKRVQHSEPKKQEPEVIIIDVDQAKQISRNKNSKTNVIGKKLKSLTTCKSIGNSKADKLGGLNETIVLEAIPTVSQDSKIEKAIKKLEKVKHEDASMMHSSQKPAEKLPLTKGRTVDTMVKRLSVDSPSSPPPKTNILVTPNVSVQHNSNQPFSYTRGISPEKYNGNDPGSPVIYAQVVCANGVTGQSKQTVHTVFNGNAKKHPHYSDSDEGLGYEEHTNRKYSPLEPSFSRKYQDQHMSEMRDEDFMDTDEPLINRKMKSSYFTGYSYENTFADTERGRADGMDAKRRESLSESLENGTPKTNNHNGISSKSDWSARRDLLESRIKHKLNSNFPRDDTNMFISESTLKYKNKSVSPVGHPGLHTNSYVDQYVMDSRKKYFEDRKDEVEYVTNGRYPFEQKIPHNRITNSRLSPDRRHFESNHFKNDRFSNKIERQQRLSKDRAIYQSNPEIYDNKKEPHSVDSYHDSLRREKRVYRSEKYLDQNENERKDRFGDSGIESDIRRDCVDNIRTEPRRLYGIRNVESEDEGFASSLLIANERQHTEEAVNNRKFSGDYEYDAPYERDEYEYRKRRTEYAPRERSIDDGSHYDPRIDKNFENEKKMMAKKTDKKNSKTGKKSGLEKVKQLFMSSSRKKEKQAMVKEEDLRSRYKEYKGSTECLEPQIKKKEMREVNTVSNIYKI